MNVIKHDPFGLEWENEMRLLSKDSLIHYLKATLKRKPTLKRDVNKDRFSVCGKYLIPSDLFLYNLIQNIKSPLNTQDITKTVSCLKGVPIRELSIASGLNRLHHAGKLDKDYSERSLIWSLGTGKLINKEKFYRKIK